MNVCTVLQIVQKTEEGLSMCSINGVSAANVACRLDSLACQQAISEMFLNAIDGCSEGLQKEIITLLPELLSEEEHKVCLVSAILLHSHLL